MAGIIKDIRLIKRNLRQKYRTIRDELSIEEKIKRDRAIYNRFINSDEYKNCETLFCFVSTTIEVDTQKLLIHALNNGKVVAVPKCTDKNGNMQFYKITSFDDLSEQMYGLLEPDESKCEVINDYTKALCIVPGFAFDPMGYRIGFGKGFYDRFLSNFVGIKIGICYNNCIDTLLPHGRYDVAVDYIITEKYTITTLIRRSKINE